MEIESSIVASQNALAVNSPQREPQRDAAAQQQVQQRQAATELPPARVVVRQANAQAFAEAEQYQQRSGFAYEQPNNKAKSALDAYQSLQREQKRSELQSLLGVDIYA